MAETITRCLTAKMIVRLPRMEYVTENFHECLIIDGLMETTGQCDSAKTTYLCTVFRDMEDAPFDFFQMDGGLMTQ